MLCFSMIWFRKGNPAFSFSKLYLSKRVMPLVMECLPLQPACTSLSSIIYSPDVLSTKGEKQWNAQQLAEHNHGYPFYHIRVGKKKSGSVQYFWMSLSGSRNWANWSFLSNQHYSRRQAAWFCEWPKMNLVYEAGSFKYSPSPVGSASAMLGVWVKSI